MLIAGLLAAVVAVLLTVQFPTVTPTFALRETIIVLAGVVVGGMTRLLSATLGGFAIGYVSGLLGGALPTSQSQYLPSFVFGLVILVLLVRPDGPVHPRARPSWSAYESASRARSSCSAPVALVVAAGAPRHAGLARRPRSTSSTRSSPSSIVVAIYVFVGNSGVLSFGHISFVAVGAWAAGVLSVPEQEKPAIMPYLFDFLPSTRPSGTSRRSSSRRAVGGVFALARRAPADAPLGPRGGHRDVRRARDHEQPPPLLREDRPRA